MAKLVIEIVGDEAKLRRIKDLVREVGAQGRQMGAELSGASRGSDVLSASMGRLKAAIAGAFTLTAVMAAVRGVVSAVREMEAANAQVLAGLRSTGYASGQTAQSIDRMATSLSRLTGVDDEVIKSAQAVLLTFRNIRGEAFERTTKAALDLSARMGGDLQSAMIMLSKALNEPEQALLALTRAGVQFSDEQKKVIKSLADMGAMAEAQTLILREVETQFEGSAEAARNTLGGALDAVGVAFGNLAEEAGRSSGIVTAALDRITESLNVAKDNSDALIAAWQLSSPGLLTWSAILENVADAWTRLKEVTGASGSIADLGKLETLTTKAAAAERARTDAIADQAAKGAAAHIQFQARLKDYEAFGKALEKADAEAEKLAAELRQLTENQSTPREQMLADMARLLELTAALPESAAAAAMAYRRMIQELKELEKLSIVRGQIDVVRGPQLGVVRGTLDIAGRPGSPTELQLIAEDWKAAMRDMHTGATETIRQIRLLVQLGELTAEQGAEAVRITLDSYARGWVGFLTFLGDVFGGFFSKVARLAQDMLQTYQQVKGAGQSIGGAFGSALSIAAPFIAVMTAAYNIFKSHAENRQARKYDTAAVLSMSGGGEWNVHLTGQAHDASVAIQKTVDAFAEAIGGTVQSFAALEVRVRRDGKYFQAWVEGVLIGKFESLEEATAAALLQAFKSPKTMLRGLSDLVRQGFEQIRTAPIPDSAGALAGIQEWLVSLREIAELDWSQGARQTAESVRHMDELWRALAKVNEVTPAVLKGFADIAASEIASWQAWQDSLTGREKTKAELLADKQKEGELYESQRKLRILELKFREQELLAMLNGTQIQGRLVQTRIQIEREALEIDRQHLLLRGQMVAYEAQLVGVEADIVNAQLEIIRQMIANLEAMAIDISKITIPGGGGPDRKAAQQGVRDWLADRQMSRLPPLQQELARLTKEYDEQIKAAGKNKELLGELNAERKEEIRLLGARIKEELISPFMGSPGARSDFARQMAEINKAYEDARKVARQTGVAIWALNAAERERLRILGLQAAASLGVFWAQTQLEMEEVAKTLDFLRLNQEALGLSAEDFARIVDEVSDAIGLRAIAGIEKYITDEKTLRELTELRYDLEIAQAKIQLELALATGVIAQATYDYYMGIIRALPPDLPGAGGGSSQDDYTGSTFAGQQQRDEAARQAFADWNARLIEIEDLAFDPLSRELRALTVEFDAMREALGDSERIQRAYGLALADILNRYLDPIREYQRSLATSASSPLGTLEQFGVAREQFFGGARAILGGDYSRLGDVTRLAQTVLDLGRQTYGGEAYSKLFRDINSVLTQITGIATPGRSMASPASSTDVQSSSSAIVQATIESTSEIVLRLERLIAKAEASINLLDSIRINTERDQNTGLAATG